MDADGYPSNNDNTTSTTATTAAGRASPPGAERVHNGVVTPHASFLALRFAPREALDEPRAGCAATSAIYGDGGFYDSVNVAAPARSPATTSRSTRA